MAIGHHVEYLSIKFYMQTWSGRSTHITMPNFLETGLSKAVILRFFKFSTYLLPSLSWIFEISKFYWQFGWRGSRRISVPKFVKICQSVAKILRFFDFSRWRLRPSWIVKFAKFYWLTVSGGHRASLYQMLSKFIVQLRR